MILASVALVVAGASLAVGVSGFARGDGNACRTAAWDSEPATAALPAGWTLTTSQVGVDGLGMSFSGTPADSSSTTPTIYLTVSCYGDDAAGAMSRSRARVEAGGTVVSNRTDLGDDGYGLSDSASSAMAVQFRRGALVAYLATSGSVTQNELDTIASAVDAAMDRALSGAVVTPAPASSASPSPSSRGTSPDTSATPAADTSASPSASPAEAAPELIAILPAELNGTALSRDSAAGADVLGSDSVSRALGAAVRGLGAADADLHVAQAYDSTGTLDVYVLAFGVADVSGAKLEPTILDTWLSAGATGVTTKSATVGGKTVTTVDYGDEGAMAYVRTTATAVIVIETADPTLAGQVVALLP